MTLCVVFFCLFVFFEVLKIELRALRVLGKHFITEPHTRPLKDTFYQKLKSPRSVLSVGSIGARCRC